MAGQFPAWVQLPRARIASAGTDNEIFRLGDDMAMRLPKVEWAEHQPEREFRWLPRLAGQLPLAIPKPIALGKPDREYPWPWSICEWLTGETAIPRRLSDRSQAAATLAGFVTAMRRIDTTDAPQGGPHNHYRGVPLADLDGRVRRRLQELDGRIDIEAATAAWNTALATPPWTSGAVWLHGDLHPQNLLAVEGRLSAVIDFGLMGTGDPAADLTPAWSMFQGEARRVFHAGVGVDEDTWSRGKGWALYGSLVVLPFYWETNPTLIRHCLGTLSEVLNDEDRVS